jgi:hypothetical protein
MPNEGTCPSRRGAGAEFRARRAAVSTIPHGAGCLSEPSTERARRRQLGLLAMLGAMALWGCERQGAPSRAATTTRPAPSEIVLTTPKDAARSVLLCLRAQRAARLRHDREADKYYQEQLRALAARDVILKRYEGLTHSPPAKPDELLDTFVRGWGPIIGSYAAGLHLDQLQAPGPPATTSPVNVHVPATSATDHTVIRLECFREPDGLWRVARLDFAPAPPASQSATKPAP